MKIFLVLFLAFISVRFFFFFQVILRNRNLLTETVKWITDVTIKNINGLKCHSWMVLSSVLDPNIPDKPSTYEMVLYP